jgi:hypothetical protein
VASHPRNPFRNEADAFRLLLLIGAAAAVVIVVALVISPLAGALVGLVAVAIGAWRAWGWLREWLAARPEDAAGPDA